MTNNSRVPSFSKEQVNTALASGLANANFYQELVIENRLGHTLFVMRYPGRVESVPSTNSTNGSNPLVEVKVLPRNYQTTSPYGYSSNITDPRGRILERYLVKLEQLQQGPVFIRELGWSMGLQNDTEALKSVNPYSDQYYALEVTQRMRSDFSNGRSCAAYVYVNLHDTSITTLYLELNGQLLGTKVNHYADQEEICALSLRREGRLNDDSVTTYIIPPSSWQDDDIKCFQAIVEGRTWTFGTDKTKVFEQIQKDREELESRYTRKELDTQIEIATKTRDLEIANLKRQIALMKDESALARMNTSNLKSELDLSNADFRKTQEQILSEQKLEIARLEAETAKYKAEAEKATMVNKTVQEELQLEQEKLKRETERRALDVKARADSYANVAQNMSSTSTMLKALAVAVPVIVSFLLWLKSPSSSSKLVQTLGIASTAPVAVFDGLVSGTSWFGRGFGCFNSVSSVIPPIIDKTVDTVKTVVKAITSTSIGQKIKSFAGRVIDKVKEVTSGILHKAGSLFRNLYNGICSWFT